MNQPWIANLHPTPPAGACTHPLNHTQLSGDPLLELDVDGSISCPHQTVPETDRQWSAQRIELAAGLFKEALAYFEMVGWDRLAA